MKTSVPIILSFMAHVEANGSFTFRESNSIERMSTSDCVTVSLGGDEVFVSAYVQCRVGTGCISGCKKESF